MDAPLLEDDGYASQLEAAVKEVRIGIEGLRGGMEGGAGRAEKIKAVKLRVKHAETLFKTVQIESRELDASKRRQVQSRAKQQHSQLKRLTADLQNISNRGELIETEMERRGEGYVHDRLCGPVASHGQARSTASVLQSAKATQDDSFDSLQRSKQLINETTEIGVSTTGVLGRQREQLVGVSRGLDEIEDELNRADKIVKAFMRRMATDKVVACLFMLIVTGVVFIIGYQIYKKSTGSDNKDR